jgi:hypothetical protein
MNDIQTNIGVIATTILLIATITLYFLAKKQTKTHH